METPWSELPTDAPYVLPQDTFIIEKFNARCADERDPKCRIPTCRGCFTVQKHLLPEPFIGHPDAPVYLLNLNPGYTPQEDDLWHRKPVYRATILANLGEKRTTHPFYFLDPRLKAAPGSAWWRQRLRWWICDVGTKTLAQNLFCAELFPYHSCRNKPVPRRISPDSLVPSSGYVAHLVREAIRAHRPIVALRAFRRWCELVPELADYSKLFFTSNPRNPSLSPKNLEGYEQLVAELRRASSSPKGHG